MIEIICNGEDDNKREGAGVNPSIRRPKNIKQIGDVSSDKKIYIEDYAFTYINSLAYNSPEEEQSGVLLGECQKNDDEKCIFIKGVIKARADEKNDGRGIYFDESIWSKIYSEVDKYFPNLQVVGWFAAMSTVTDERMQYLKRVHLDNFAGNMKTMYLINTAEKEENFYLYEGGDLRKQSGYVCFYERNYEMQEYMLEKRGRQSVESQEKDEVMKSIRNIIREKEEIKQQKKNYSLMYGVGAFMVVVVLVIGINFINSYEKMRRLDNSLNNIVKEISSMNGGAEVPANSDNVTPVNKVDGGVYPTEEATNSGQNESGANESGASNETDGANETDTTKPAETESETVSQNPSENESKNDSSVDTSGKPTQPAYSTYTVKKGDTMLSICKKHYGNAEKMDEVVKFNEMEDANKLYVGQVIKLP